MDRGAGVPEGRVYVRDGRRCRDDPETNQPEGGEIMKLYELMLKKGPRRYPLDAVTFGNQEGELKMKQPEDNLTIDLLGLPAPTIPKDVKLYSFYVVTSNGDVVEWRNLTKRAAEIMYANTLRNQPEGTTAYGWEVQETPESTSLTK